MSLVRNSSFIALAVALAGCAHTLPTSAVAARGGATQVYSVGGQPTIIVKRKDARAPLALAPNCHKVRATAIAGVEVHAVTDGNVTKALASYRNNPAVEYAEPNGVMSLPEQKRIAPSLNFRVGALPINFPGEYGPKLTRASDVQAKTDGRGQIIAIVDTGVDLGHPDLAPKLVPGTNTVDSGDAKDTEGHGTNCAGIAASLPDEQGGIIGMAPGAQIMPVKVLGEGGTGSDASVAEGIVWAADHGATVISLSLGGPGQSQTGLNAVQHALSKGAVVVAAMGNDGSGSKSFPAAYPGVIAVGATDINDQIPSFSQFGKWISVTAPGYSILSTFPTYHVAEMDSYAQEKDFWESHGMRAAEKYGYLTGTSQATPHVSGLAALVRAANPGLTPDQVKAKIEAGAVHPSGMSGKFDVHFGHGRIDASASV